MMSISRLECIFLFSLPTVASCLGADKVIDFGSLANQETGIPIDRFYAAVAEVADLSSQFKIDLVDPETCKPVVRDAILTDFFENFNFQVVQRRSDPL